MSSPRMSSKNHSPNSVLSKDSFLFLNLDFVLRCIGKGLLLPPLLLLLLFEEAGGRVRGEEVWWWVTRIVKATVFRCTLEDSSSFQRCSNLVKLTRDIQPYAVKIRNTDYRSFLPFRAMMNRNS